MFASSRILEVNPYHPLIIRLADAMSDEKQKKAVEEVSRLLLDQAKIAEGEAISDSSFFSEKLSDYILRGWQKDAWDTAYEKRSDKRAPFLLCKTHLFKQT